ncbi:hypothetical protein [Singulisphaera sp. PoT]|uniref:hypothetical protein n=1 Tax=Singulisphaera sp. PoT TaxID=3411797 RepID=UPI003BF533DC
MISKPYDSQHPLFRDQREYVLERAVLDTGDATHGAEAALTFRHHPSGQVRTFRFTGVSFTSGCGAAMGLRGYLPVYVATLSGRGWEAGERIEVGDTDPGGVWFWAETIEEST